MTSARGVRVIGAVCGTAVVVALVVLPRVLAGSTGQHAGSGSPSATSLPGYTGPEVTVSMLEKYTWRSMPSAPIRGRYSEAAAWTGTSLLVWGGTSGNDELGDGAAYDPSSRKWTTLPKAPLRARVDPSGVWTAEAFFVWGGTAGGQPLTDGARYDPLTTAWTRLPPAPVASWSQQRLVVAGDRVVLLTTPPGRTQSTIRAAVYDPARNKWSSLGDRVVADNHDIAELTTLGVGRVVFVWSEWSHTTAETPVPGPGHITGTTTTWGTDALRLDVDSGRWSTAPVAPTRGSSVANPLWTGQRIMLPQDSRYCGGCAGPPLFDPRAVTIDPDSGARRGLPGSPVAGGGSGYSWTGGSLLGVNGFSTGATRHLKPGDTAAYDPVSHRWTTLARQPAGTSVAEAVQFWTGDRLLVWGFDYGQTSTAGRGAEFVRAGA